MIYIKHFIEYNLSKSQCETNIEQDIKELISCNHIHRNDIIEYRTSVCETEHNGYTMWKYEVIISWWA